MDARTYLQAASQKLPDLPPAPCSALSAHLPRHVAAAQPRPLLLRIAPPPGGHHTLADSHRADRFRSSASACRFPPGALPGRVTARDAGTLRDESVIGHETAMVGRSV